MSRLNTLTGKPIPEPVNPDNPMVESIHDLVIQDLSEDAAKVIAQRKQFGVEKYGVFLQPFNGRDAMLDALLEAADLLVYIRQALLEGKCSYLAYQYALEMFMYIYESRFANVQRSGGRKNQKS